MKLWNSEPAAASPFGAAATPCVAARSPELRRSAAGRPEVLRPPSDRRVPREALLLALPRPALRAGDWAAGAASSAAAAQASTARSMISWKAGRWWRTCGPDGVPHPLIPQPVSRLTQTRQPLGTGQPLTLRLAAGAAEIPTRWCGAWGAPKRVLRQLRRDEPRRRNGAEAQRCGLRRTLRASQPALV